MNQNIIENKISNEFLENHLKKYNDFLLKAKYFNNIDEFKESITTNEESNNNLELVSVNDIETNLDINDNDDIIDMNEVINNMTIVNIVDLKCIKFRSYFRYTNLIAIDIYYISQISNMNYDKIEKFLDENSDFNDITMIVFNLILPLIFFNFVIINHKQIIDRIIENIKSYGFQNPIKNLSFEFVKSCIPDYSLQSGEYARDYGTKYFKYNNFEKSTGISNLSEYSNSVFAYLTSGRVLFNIYALALLYLLTAPYFVFNKLLLKNDYDDAKNILCIIEQSVFLLLINMALLLFNHNVKNEFEKKRNVYAGSCIMLVCIYLIILNFNFLHLILIIFDNIECFLLTFFLFNLLLIFSGGIEKEELEEYYEIYIEKPFKILYYLIDNQKENNKTSRLYYYTKKGIEETELEYEKERIEGREECNKWFNKIKFRLMFCVLFYIICIITIILTNLTKIINNKTKTNWIAPCYYIFGSLVYIILLIFCFCIIRNKNENKN